MTQFDRPIYLIARADKWLCHGTSDTAMAFGSEAEARACVADTAMEYGYDPASMRVVEFVFSGKVLEG